ncbi:hypothetical protein Q1695_012696 [Nippostrongylus brasiliensis]|nr:hypothetical protein Q1695_012696 [Nippostrongylus brasiliensis]
MSDISVASVERFRSLLSVCDHCSYPNRPLGRSVVTAVPYACKTDFVIDGYGCVPVINGDPKWLPMKVRAFLAFHVELMRPVAIHICSGSFSEAEHLTRSLELTGVLEKLIALDNVYAARTDPADAVERATYICCKNAEEVEAKKQSKPSPAFAQWITQDQFNREVYARFPGSMQGRVMYVIPFSMGPIGGRYSINAVQLTDSPYVVLNMRLLTRVSSSLWDAIGQADFVRCVHTIGRPRPITKKPKSNWPCNPDRFFLAHRLEEDEVWSYGSAFGENAFLSKKCLGLRLATYRGLKEGWLALNAALIAVRDPSGKDVYGCVAMPSGAGKTYLAMMTPTLKGWQVRVLGDDIAWIRCAPDRKMYAFAPENGIFACPLHATSTSSANIIKMLSKNTILVNCATTSKGLYFWEDLSDLLEPSEHVSDWRKEEWSRDQRRLPTHANCHFTALTSSAPNVHFNWEQSAGVPISFLVFGCKRPDKMPLVYEAESWEHGVVMAAGIRSVSHSALDKLSNRLVHNPLCMRTYMATTMAELVNHWLTIKEKVTETPKIFLVNWYQERADGTVIWPGYGENIRVLEWIVGRCTAPNATTAVDSPIGMLPKGLNTEGLNVDVSTLLQVDKRFWSREIREMEAFLGAEIGNRMVPIMNKILSDLSKRIASMP